MKDDDMTRYTIPDASLCHHCQLTLDPKDCGKPEHPVLWRDAYGHLAETASWVCRSCLDAGDQPGYAPLVELEGELTLLVDARTCVPVDIGQQLEAGAKIWFPGPRRCDGVLLRCLDDRGAWCLNADSIWGDWHGQELWLDDGETVVLESGEVLS